MTDPSEQVPVPPAGSHFRMEVAQQLAHAPSADGPRQIEAAPLTSTGSIEQVVRAPAQPVKVKRGLPQTPVLIGASLCLVAGLGLGLVALQGGKNAEVTPILPSTPPVAQPLDPSVSPEPTAVPSPDSTVTAVPIEPVPSDLDPTTSPSPTATASPSPSPSGTPAPTSEASDTPVIVLNSPGGSGAQALADELTAGGWTVSSTGTYKSSVASTTVYYLAGYSDDAELLMGQFPQITRMVEVTSNRGPLVVILRG